MPTVSPAPKNLRDTLVRTIESLPDEDLPMVQEVLLHAEKDRLWREISAEATAERRAGKWERLPEIIREVRERRRRG